MTTNVKSSPAMLPFVPTFTATFAEPDGSVLELSVNGNESKAAIKAVHKAFAGEVSKRKLKARRGTDSYGKIPGFEAKPYTALEKEWLNATVTFDEGTPVPACGIPSIENDHPYNIAVDENDQSHRSIKSVSSPAPGNVVGLSGIAERSLNVYVPGNGFYTVHFSSLTRVN